MRILGFRTCLQVWWLFFFGRWWGSIVHVIQGSTTYAIYRVVKRMQRASEPYHESCMTCGCVMGCLLLVSFYPTWHWCHVSGTLSQHPWLYVELWMESSVDGTSWPISWRWSNSTVSSSGSGADLSTPTAECDAESTPPFTSSISYQPSPTAYSIPPTSTTASTYVSFIPIHTTTTSATSTRASGTFGHSSQSTWAFHALQSRWDAPTDEVHSGIQYSSHGGKDSSPVCSTTSPNLPATMPLHPPSHYPSTIQHPPPRQRSPRRSRSHHHGSSPRRPDKRPVSTRRSPRRRRSSRRQRRSSKNRSYSRSQSRHRHDSPRRDRESSITLKSASPQRRDDRTPIEEYHQSHDYSSTKPTLQASSWWKNQHSTEYNNPTEDSYHPDTSSRAKWKSWGKWKNYPKYQSTWEDPKQSSKRYDSSHDPTTKPLTAFSTSKSAPTRHKKTTPDNSGDDQSQFSEPIPSGHMLINLRDGSKEEWIRGVRFWLRHPDRKKAASEVPYAEQPKPIKTVGIEEFQRAVATLQRTDPKIPPEITKKAISSTNLLPVFDLERSFTIDLPSTNMLALILPLPEMPPPFIDTQNLGTPSRHCHRNRSSHLAGRKDQTGQLVIQQKPQQMWYAHFWSFLSWQRSRQKRYLSRLGSKRIDGYHSKERERTTRRDRGGNVSRNMPSHCVQSWRQWNGTALSCWQRGGHHLGKIHHCPQQSCWIEIHRFEVAGLANDRRWWWFVKRRLHLPRHQWTH